MTQITIAQYNDAISVLKASRNRLRDVVIHACMLHMVYGVPISDTIKYTGRATNTEAVNRASVYNLKEKVDKTIAFINESNQ